MPSQNATQFKCNQVFDVSHVTAVFTSAGSGVGLMIAQALIANGARVYVVDRRKDALDTVIRLYNTGPGEMIP
jgi:NADP-dependent 3-hydroxy acid dehydrogenase YdfG